jgi:uncharacterized protein YndB with AHSA1/START domain
MQHRQRAVETVFDGARTTGGKFYGADFFFGERVLMILLCGDAERNEGTNEEKCEKQRRTSPHEFLRSIRGSEISSRPAKKGHAALAYSKRQNAILANGGLSPAFYILKETIAWPNFDAAVCTNARILRMTHGAPMKTILSEKITPSAAVTSPTRRQIISGTAIAFGALTLGATKLLARPEEVISHSADSIRMENVFAASRKRVYDALTDAKQFTEIVKLSAATKSGMVKDAAPAEISREAGGAFKLFGGIIIGRQLELVPNERIVQAWRVAYWEAGAFSIAKFKLVEEGAGTKIIFDHEGFPKGDAENLVTGWKGNYWEPLAKFLA